MTVDGIAQWGGGGRGGQAFAQKNQDLLSIENLQGQVRICIVTMKETPKRRIKRSRRLLMKYPRIRSGE
jgi:hypothetical protein